jgi:hypothetical protein
VSQDLENGGKLDGLFLENMDNQTQIDISHIYRDSKTFINQSIGSFQSDKDEKIEELERKH